MAVYVQRHPDVIVSSQILNFFNVQPALDQPHDVCMPQDMGRRAEVYLHDIFLGLARRDGTAQLMLPGFPLCLFSLGRRGAPVDDSDGVPHPLEADMLAAGSVYDEKAVALLYLLRQRGGQVGRQWDGAVSGPRLERGGEFRPSRRKTHGIVHGQPRRIGLQVDIPPLQAAYLLPARLPFLIFLFVIFVKLHYNRGK